MSPRAQLVKYSDWLADSRRQQILSDVVTTRVNKTRTQTKTLVNSFTTT